MEFTAGLMPLETALSQMLSRITPLTAVETLPLVPVSYTHLDVYKRQPVAGVA